MKNLDPVWNEVMVFEIVFNQIRDVQCVLYVRDYNRHLPNKTIGQVVIGSRSTSGAAQKHWSDMLSSSRKAVSMWHKIVKKQKIVYS